MSVAANNRHKPDARQAVSLFLRMIEARQIERGKSMTRVRLPEITLKGLWKRERLTQQFLEEVKEWMLTAGWALIDGGSTFAAVKVDAILNWPRVSIQRINNELTQVSNGNFDYEQLEHLWIIEESAPEGADEQDH